MTVYRSVPFVLEGGTLNLIVLISYLDLSYNFLFRNVIRIFSV